MALGSSQPLTEMSTRNVFLGVKGERYVGLTTLSPSCGVCLKIWKPLTPANLRACSGLYIGLLYLFFGIRENFLYEYNALTYN